MPQTLIFTATFNEKENVLNLVNEINSISDDIDILIVDDNSPDGTGEVLNKLIDNHKNLKVIHRENKSGLDTAHKLGFKYAKEKNYEKFITMDADLSHEPKEIPKILEVLNKEAFVIGSRYIDGGSCEMSFLRTVISVMGNKIIKNFLKIRCNEFTTSYRGFNLNKLKNFDLKLVKSKGYSFFMETIFRLNQKGFKINEIPIQFRNRAQGKSKIPKLEIFRTLKNLVLLKFFD
tara:strand:+ start:1644 stop:2342 length:699 start_codon:yes stop_codon:yes gene_type:complete